jgi:hypothetical protein
MALALEASVGEHRNGSSSIRHDAEVEIGNEESRFRAKFLQHLTSGGDDCAVANTGWRSAFEGDACHGRIGLRCSH